MSTRSLARYARQIVLREVGVNGQQVLRDSSALIVGLGGLGTPAALYLAGAGLGRLVLTDFDRVHASNLHRQVLYRGEHVGQDKLDSAREQLEALNPDCAVECRTGPLDAAALLDAARSVDVVLDCTDNFPSRFAINRACVTARKPLVSGAAIRFEGQLAIFDSARGTACYACLFPSSSGGEAQETCEEAGILGPVVGTIGTRQALATLKLLLGLGDDARGTLWVWDALTDASRRLSIPRDPRCPVCGNISP
ncbi:MAG: molybdopterin biosynthesis protein MoeB [Panacagrimonas sp.]|jgi:molybdopterin/thiamine biosynthesis adenylyltransferase|nr:molybdopterin-synthase adenylyltransferase MoeB [Panacagrimonas sp.]MCC2655454.1 molybdopterin biosynthesis protein MoeB [Panacagrimonas sp.]